MSTKKGFPMGDVIFNVAFNQLMEDLGIMDPDSTAPAVVTWTRLGLDNPTQFAILLSFLVRWNKVYPLQRSIATRNGTTKTERNTVKKGVLDIIKPERLLLKAKETQTPGFLSTKDKKVWYIDAVTARTFKQAPAGAPLVVVESNEHLLHLLRVTNPATPGKTAKGDGVSHIE